MKHLIYIFILPTIFLLSSFSAFGQIGEGGIPISFTDSSCSSQESVQSMILPLINNDSLRTLDSVGQSNSFGPFTFAVPVKIDIDLQDNATWEMLEDSSRIGRLKISSPNAYSSFLIFDKFFLPNGTKLFAYNEDRTQVLGAFTYKNNKPYGRFSIGPVIGETVILEYFEPANLDTTAQLHITSFIHSYKNLFNHVVDGGGNSTFGNSSSCNINVRCPEGNGWCNQRRSVALIVALDPNSHFIAICTGALVTNERRDLRPYFLTAHHCQIGDNVNDWIFIFNYQSDNCTNPANAPPTTFSITGATLRANRCKSDFALLELSSRPPGDYNTYYAGWDNENTKPQDGASITHPRGDIKKIALYSKKGTRKSKNFNTGCNVKTWKIKWDDGTVEPGSSGGPLFNDEGLIVGQVFGGDVSDICTSNDKAFFGRFNKSWDAGNSSSDRLRDWLSPNSTSSFFIQSMSGDEPCKPSYFFENVNDLHTSTNINGLNNPGSAGTRTYNGVYTASGTIVTGQNVTIQSGTSVEFYGESITLGPGFHAEAGSNFIASPQPCLRGCNTGVGKMAGDIDNDEPFIVFNTDNPKYEKESEEKKEPQTIKVSENIQIYPNPNAGKFEIEFSEENTVPSKIIIYDLAGKTVYEQNNITQNRITVDISRYQKGIYTVQIIQNENTYTRKIILQ